MKIGPTIETPRLILRPFVLSDASKVQKMAGRIEIAENNLKIPYPYDEGVAEEWILENQEKYRKGERISFAIVCKSDNELIGSFCIKINKEHLRGELGYWIGIEYWGKGYCTEAAITVRNYGFETLNLNKISASSFKKNTASRRILEKIGLKFEGCRRQHILKWGKFEDIDDFGMLKHEYEKLKKSHPSYFEKK